MPRRNAKRTISEIRRNALKSGYRSGLEVTLAQQIEKLVYRSNTRPKRSTCVASTLGDLHARFLTRNVRWGVFFH